MGLGIVGFEISIVRVRVSSAYERDMLCSDVDRASHYITSHRIAWQGITPYHAALGHVINTSTHHTRIRLAAITALYHMITLALMCIALYHMGPCCVLHYTI